jgi:hypothetical protein
MSFLIFAWGKDCVKSICLPLRLCMAERVFTIRIVLHCTTGANDSV